MDSYLEKSGAGHGYWRPIGPQPDFAELEFLVPEKCCGWNTKLTRGVPLARALFNWADRWPQPQAERVRKMLKLAAAAWSGLAYATDFGVYSDWLPVLI